jgi:hypothetical protein|tara:strand:- start:305 stop:493 length:189 start_codon:yes stop_codon:yes gene_type:complete
MSQQPPYLRLVEKDEIGDVTETLASDWKPKRDVKTLALVGITMGILLAVVCVSIIAFVIAWI